MNINQYSSMLDTQLCFPLYVAAKELTHKYKSYLNKYGLTYTQYLAMQVLWEKDGISVSELSRILYLDSATLTPLLKRLESRFYITRTNSGLDRRSVIVTLTKEGRDLQTHVEDIPAKVAKHVNLSERQNRELKNLLHTLLDNIRI